MAYSSIELVASSLNHLQKMGASLGLTTTTWQTSYIMESLSCEYIHITSYITESVESSYEQCTGIVPADSMLGHPHLESLSCVNVSTTSYIAESSSCVEVSTWPCAESWEAWTVCTSTAYAGHSLVKKMLLEHIENCIPCHTSWHTQTATIPLPLHIGCSYPSYY